MNVDLAGSSHPLFISHIGCLRPNWRHATLAAAKTEQASSVAVPVVEVRHVRMLVGDRLVLVGMRVPYPSGQAGMSVVVVPIVMPVTMRM